MTLSPEAPTSFTEPEHSGPKHPDIGQGSEHSDVAPTHVPSHPASFEEQRDDNGNGNDDGVDTPLTEDDFDWDNMPDSPPLEEGDPRAVTPNEVDVDA